MTVLFIVSLGLADAGVWQGAGNAGSVLSLAACSRAHAEPVKAASYLIKGLNVPGITPRLGEYSHA